MRGSVQFLPPSPPFFSTKTILIMSDEPILAISRVKQVLALNVLASDIQLDQVSTGEYQTLYGPTGWIHACQRMRHTINASTLVGTVMPK